VTTAPRRTPDAAEAATAARVTVVVITMNRGPLLARSVRSLFAQTHRPLEIVIVDDGSTDDTPQVIADLADEAPRDVPVVARAHERNRGIGAARNTGIDAATGAFVAFTDDDCVADPTWIEELVRPFATDERIAVTGGGIDEPADRTWAQEAAEGINFLGTEERDVRSVVGCNMAYRAEFLARQPFDPEAQYGDDLDRCFAAAADGLRVHFTPRARVTHHHRRSIRAFLRQQVARGRGSVWVRRKHRLGLWPNKNWVVLLVVVAALAAPFVPPPLGALGAGAAFALFVAQVLVLDRSLGKSLGRSLRTLPLALPGYVAEFWGAASEVVRSRLGRGR